MTQKDNAPQEIAARQRLIAGALSFEALPDAVLGPLAEAAEAAAWSEGETIYEGGSVSDDIYIVEQGVVRLEPEPPRTTAQLVRAGEAFGWTAFYASATRRNRAVAATSVKILRVSGQQLINLLSTNHEEGIAVQARIASAVDEIRAPQANALPLGQEGRWTEAARRAVNWLQSPAPYLMLTGYALLLGFWYLSVQVLKLPRFNGMPGLTDVIKEWTSHNPTYGVSLFTPVYYLHIWVSLERILIAFGLATLLGVPVGLFLGWSETFRDYMFPVFELLRPIPPMAWVPIAIVMLPGSALPIIYLTFLASFFATALNAMLGVKSIDPVYVQAASCLGASRWHVFFTVIVPGALPQIFTGLQISIGVAWFSLVAAEMVSGQFGLGYLINTAYTTVEYPTMVIAMLTLGIVGYVTSALVRLLGVWAVGWRGRQLAMDGGL